MNASAKVNGSKLAIDLGGRADLVAMVRELPEARFNSRTGTWAASATPLACNTLAFDSRISTDTSAEIYELAMEYDAAMVPATAGQLLSLNYKTNPWAHQKRALSFSLNKYATLLAMEMGTGKSLVAVSLLANWGVETALILCPRAVIGVWRREFARHFPGDHRVMCLEKGTGKTKTADVSSFMASEGDDPKFVVINYEAAWRDPIAKRLLAEHWGAVILDESHRIKSHSGRASKFCYQLGKRAGRKLCLTGTPMPHSPLDLYAQFRFLEPAVFGTSFTRFRARYAQCNEVFKSKVDAWINQDELKSKYSPLTFRVESKDVLDLPSCLHEQISFELTPKTQRVYDAMENEMVVELDDGEASASNALVKLLRLQQITTGVIKDEADVLQRVGTEKVEALADLLADVPADEPVVVFCRFQSDLDAIADVSVKLNRIYGEVSGRRKDLTDHATMPEGITLMGVQEQAGGAGIDLTAARYAVWFSLSFSLGDYEQANARVHRPGQKRPVTIYHLVADGTIDQAVYRALDKRRNIVDSVLESLKHEPQMVEV